MPSQLPASGATMPSIVRSSAPILADEEPADTSPTAVYGGRSLCQDEGREPQEEQSSSSFYDTDDDSYYAEFGFLFENNHPVRIEHFRWQIEPDEETVLVAEDGNSPSRTQAAAIVAVSVAIADTDIMPSTVMSGLYLSPASSVLAEYLVRHYYYHGRQQHQHQQVQSVVELGAGCGLVSLTALQLWQNSLQCLVVTDHDPNTLARARDNLESTMQALIMDAAAEDDIDDDNNNNNNDENDQHLNGIINSLASIPVAFESLEWGDDRAIQGVLRNQIREHSQFAQAAHLILGSDLIDNDDDITVVEPLLRTAHALMAPATGCFLLCQSIPLSPDVEDEIVRVCTNLHLQRRVLDENRHNSGCRIDEFSYQPN
jgi:predicted nicotinamide N-methyase